MVKYQVLEEQFTLLYNSIESISNAKNIQDKFETEIEMTNNNIAKQNSENNALANYVKETTAERDYYRKQTVQLLEKKATLEKEKYVQMETFKKRLFELDRDLKAKNEECDENFERKQELEREKKTLVADREKMKERIKKLKSKKGKFDAQQKVCKACGKDYSEKENFNWSCRIHRSEFSGEIWWCCGKERQDQPGCKYSSHQSKDEEDEDMADDANQQKPIKNIRCYCCKEVGHLIDACPRDPNIRSKHDTEADYMRIQQIKDYRKLNADTVVTTTHFLKKCILVPTRQSEQEEKVS